MIKIPSNKLDWEDYHSPCGALYQNKKFTGIAYDDGRKIYSETVFVNGKRNGREYGIVKETQTLRWETFYKDDIPVGITFGWHNMEELKITHKYEDGIIVYAKVENKEGKLIEEFDRIKKEWKKWYLNGKIQFHKTPLNYENEYQHKKEVYWNDDGTWLMTIEFGIEYLFNSQYLLKEYRKIQSHQLNTVLYNFLSSLISKEKEIALDFCHKLTTHKNPFIRFQAAKQLGVIQDKSSIPYLEKLLKDDVHPKTEMEKDWHGRASWTKTPYPISTMAEVSIQIIK